MASIFRKIWLVWATSMFLFMMLLSVPVLLWNMLVTPGERALRHNIFYLHHVFTPVFLSLAGVRLRVSGKECLKPGVSYVIVSNHRSSLDFIVNAHAFPGVFRFLAKKELQKIPVFGWVVKKMCLTVDRSSAMSRARSVVALKNSLKEGWSIFIYPEGSRNKSAEPLADFFDGAFRVAIQTGAPVAVQTILNIRELTGPDESGFQPGIVRIVWDEPIETAGLKDSDIPALREQVKARMLARLNA